MRVFHRAKLSSGATIQWRIHRGGGGGGALFLDQTEARRGSGSDTAIPFYGNKAETIELVFTRPLFTRHKIRSGYTRQHFAATHAAATNHFLCMAPP